MLWVWPQQPSAIDLLIYWSIDLLIYWSIDLLIYWSIDLLIYWSTDLLIYWSIDLPFQCCHLAWQIKYVWIFSPARFLAETPRNFRTNYTCKIVYNYGSQSSELVTRCLFHKHFTYLTYSCNKISSYILKTLRGIMHWTLVQLNLLGLKAKI